LQVSLESARATAPEEQADLAVTEVLKILNAERAFLFYAGKDGSVSVVAGRDSHGQPLAELRGFSSTVVKRVASERRALVISGTEHSELGATESITAHDLRSMIAAPLMMKDRLTGVLYLDSRLASGLFTEDDVGILQAICNHIAIAQESARMAQLETERAVLEQEAVVTAAVQSLLLPQAPLVEFGSIAVGVYFQPAVRAGGDWYWYEKTSDDHVLLLLGDVTGHGAGAAMVTAVIAGSYRTLISDRQAQAAAAARKGGESACTQATIDRPQILHRLHEILSYICRGQYAASMSVVDIDPMTSTITWWNAGGPPVMVLKQDGSCDIITEIGATLGNRGIHGDQLQLGLRAWSYDSGDRLLLFSDGVSEMVLPNGRELGYRRLRRRLVDTREYALGKAVDHLGAVRDMMNPDEEADDMTMIVVDLA